MARQSSSRPTQQNPGPSPAGGSPSEARRVREWDPNAPVASQAAGAGAAVEAAYRKSGITAAMLQVQKQVQEQLTGPQAYAVAAQAATSGKAGPENIVGTFIGEKW